jgi:hypothetical protein
MKQLIFLLYSTFLLIVFTFSGTTCFGKNYFRINSKIGSKEIIVNGKLYKIDSGFTKIETQYPKFDLLSFKYDAWVDDIKIYCNFKPDSSYTCILACCGSTDIVSSWKTEHDSLGVWGLEKTQALLMDKPVFTLKTIHATLKDSIYAWYADHSCYPTFKIVDDSGWKYGTMVKCGYWNNISPFLFFKSSADYSENRRPDGTVVQVFPEEGYKEQGIIYIRLFDNKSYTISFDYATKNIRLSYDKQ